MLITRQIHAEPTRKSVTVEAYLCGSKRGSSLAMTTIRSFGPVAQPRNLDWLGPGS